MFVKMITTAVHYTPWHKRLFASAEEDHIGAYIVKNVCIHNPESRNSWDGITEEACYFMMVVLLQYGLYSLTFVI